MQNAEFRIDQKTIQVLHSLNLDSKDQLNQPHQADMI
jgi:hypothetical protein